METYTHINTHSYSLKAALPNSRFSSDMEPQGYVSPPFPSSLSLCTFLPVPPHMALLWIPVHFKDWSNVCWSFSVYLASLSIWHCNNSLGKHICLWASWIYSVTAFLYFCDYSVLGVLFCLHNFFIVSIINLTYIYIGLFLEDTKNTRFLFLPHRIW